MDGFKFSKEESALGLPTKYEASFRGIRIGIIHMDGEAPSAYRCESFDQAADKRVRTLAEAKAVFKTRVEMAVWRSMEH